MEVLGEPTGDSICVAALEIEGVTVVLVVVLDPADDLEAEMLVKSEGVLVRRPGVAGDGAVLVGDQFDETLAETLSSVFGIDRQKEEIAVPARSRKSDETIVDEQEMDRGTPIGIGKETAALPEHVLANADILLQPPSRLDVRILTRSDDLQIDVDTHYQ